jgi:solute carrier family 25 (mitochondrial phosphate transporter), member 23/24/25/41
MQDAYAARYPDSEPGIGTLLACGATATTCGQVVSYPLQLVRTRLQAQGMEGRPVLYSGITDCLRRTVQLDGLAGLFRGIGPNFLVSCHFTRL